MTLDWEDNDTRMARFMADKLRTIAEAMGPKAVRVHVKSFGDHFDSASCQTTHPSGGAIMGADPATSAVNRYLQSWDVHNVFAPGASALPHGLGYNPAGLLAALTYWPAKAIRQRYLAASGPLQ